jgi:hypothetical protein
MPLAQRVPMRRSTGWWTAGSTRFEAPTAYHRLGVCGVACGGMGSSLRFGKITTGDLGDRGVWGLVAGVVEVAGQAPGGVVAVAAEFGAGFGGEPCV